MDGDPIPGAVNSTYDASAAGDYTIQGILADDGSAACNGSASAQSPPINLNTDACVCGDGDVAAVEGCDDGNTTPGDGCSATCTVESGYGCTGEPSDCDAVCGDGLIVGSEGCDDSNTTPGDGCSATCTVESGYGCTGEPSDCDAVCGDGLIVGGEGCDDSNTTPGDGCSATCTVESGYGCTGEPSSCATVCGDGLIVGGEGCDDSNTTPGDGCSATCTVESGYGCTGEPSSCATVCGDGLIRGSEACDDSNTTPGDGCSATCTVESGFGCTGEPSDCDPVCGDGLIRGAEACDDANTTPGDGCSAVCEVESGFECSGEPSVCITDCGDGLIRDAETCDDGNETPGDGCSATCAVESGYECIGEPSSCATVCGDGLIRGTEACDDSNTTPGDGCSDTCAVESGYGCTGEPSSCTTVCGDGLIGGTEACDDSNTTPGDGCSATCTIEHGYGCTGEPSACSSTCGDGLIANDEECDDANVADGDGCDSVCVVEDGFECTGEPSECTEGDPTLQQLLPGCWPDISPTSQHIVFVSNEDADNDSRTTAVNGDGSEEVFMLNRKAKKKNGPGLCLGGVNDALPCDSQKDCPGTPPVKLTHCARYSQLTDTVAGGTAFEIPAVSRGGKKISFSDLTTGPADTGLWDRRTFEKTSPLAALSTVGEATSPSLQRGGRYVAVESTSDLVGNNADGNSEIFVYDVAKGFWTQVTDTVAPVQNGRPRMSFTQGVVFDSNGDLGDDRRPAHANADGNREIFRVLFGKKNNKTQQLTSTIGPDLQLECATYAGNWIFFSSAADLHNDGAPALSNADGNTEMFRWRRGSQPGGLVAQLTDSLAPGENVNADCAPASARIAFESTADLDGGTATNRRIYYLNPRTGQRTLITPLETGENTRPKVSRSMVVFESTADLTGRNPAGEKVIFLYDSRRPPVETGP